MKWNKGKMVIFIVNGKLNIFGLIMLRQLIVQELSAIL